MLLFFPPDCLDSYLLVPFFPLPHPSLHPSFLRDFTSQPVFPFRHFISYCYRVHVLLIFSKSNILRTWKRWWRMKKDQGKQKINHSSSWHPASPEVPDDARQANSWKGDREPCWGSREHRAQGHQGGQRKLPWSCSVALHRSLNSVSLICKMVIVSSTCLLTLAKIQWMVCGRV